MQEIAFFLNFFNKKKGNRQLFAYITNEEVKYAKDFMVNIFVSFRCQS